MATGIDTPDALAETFRSSLGERILGTEPTYGTLTVTVEADAFPQVARFCKQDLGMTFFDWLSAVDEREDGFSVVAHLYNHVTRTGVLVKAMVPGGREAPRFPTITDTYRGADWHEREAYDMFGIVFEGHPRLLPRILTVENFEGWPLRKEFKLASRVVKPWPGAKEPADPGEEEGGASATSAKPTDAPGADPADRAAAAKAKAERAKAKAAEARKRKAEEKAAAQAADGPAADGPAADDPGTDGSIDQAEPGSAREAAQAAAGQETAAGTPDATTPEGAAEVADTPIAKDAAAGVTAGQELAPGEQPGSDQPRRDPEREAEMGEGGPAQDSGAPGVEREGTHDLDSSTARTDVSDEPDPEDVADRERAGLGPEGTGTFADSTRPDHADGSAGTDADVSDAEDDPSAVDPPEEGDHDE